MVPNGGISSFVWQASSHRRRLTEKSFKWIFVSEFEIRISNLFRHGSFVLRHLFCSLPFQHLLLNFFMPERIQKPIEPAPWGPKQGDGGGPRSPDVSRPDTKDLLKKMRKVDPNQSKRYRQRTGQ
jgi:hypothetical protein